MALVSSLLIHSVVIVGFYILEHPGIGGTNVKEMLFGGSGGGGGEDALDDAMEFGPPPRSEDTSGKDVVYAPHLNLVQIHVYDDNINAIPVPKKEEPRPVVKQKRKSRPIIAENLPTRWVRRGTGPGSGGGAGGGSGGGIGSHTGYSIDWGGGGSRRLLSGRLPTYPKGTDKQMAVVLEFTVLPDGSVDAIIPLRKTDELLEGAAIGALRTWRFDPLPAQIEQQPERGKVTFNFKLEAVQPQKVTEYP